MTKIFLLLVVFSLGLADEEEDRCLLPMVEGPCRALFFRWAYHQELKKCIQLIYGGCEGNANNFESEYKCKIYCIHRTYWRPPKPSKVDAPKP